LYAQQKKKGGDPQKALKKEWKKKAKQYVKNPLALKARRWAAGDLESWGGWMEATGHVLRGP
jgi:hypothetical protein